MPELQLSLKAPQRPRWPGITIRSSDPLEKHSIGLMNLQGSAALEALKQHLPNGERIAVSFGNDYASLRPNFPIKRNGHVVHKGEDIILPRKGGRITIGIGGIVYVASVI